MCACPQMSDTKTPDAAAVKANTKKPKRKSGKGKGKGKTSAPAATSSGVEGSAGTTESASIAASSLSVSTTVTATGAKQDGESGKWSFLIGATERTYDAETDLPTGSGKTTKVRTKRFTSTKSESDQMESNARFNRQLAPIPGDSKAHVYANVSDADLINLADEFKRKHDAKTMFEAGQKEASQGYDTPGYARELLHPAMGVSLGLDFGVDRSREARIEVPVLYVDPADRAKDEVRRPDNPVRFRVAQKEVDEALSDICKMSGTSTESLKVRVMGAWFEGAKNSLVVGSGAVAVTLGIEEPHGRYHNLETEAKMIGTYAHDLRVYTAEMKNPAIAARFAGNNVMTPAEMAKLSELEAKLKEDKKVLEENKHADLVPAFSKRVAEGKAAIASLRNSAKERKAKIAAAAGPKGVAPAGQINWLIPPTKQSEIDEAAKKLFEKEVEDRAVRREPKTSGGAAQQPNQAQLKSKDEAAARDARNLAQMAAYRAYAQNEHMSKIRDDTTESSTSLFWSNYNTHLGTMSKEDIACCLATAAAYGNVDFHFETIREFHCFQAMAERKKWSPKEREKHYLEYTKHVPDHGLFRRADHAKTHGGLSAFSVGWGTDAIDKAGRVTASSTTDEEVAAWKGRDWIPDPVAFAAYSRIRAIADRVVYATAGGKDGVPLSADEAKTTLSTVASKFFVDGNMVVPRVALYKILDLFSRRASMDDTVATPKGLIVELRPLATGKLRHTVDASNVPTGVRGLFSGKLCMRLLIADSRVQEKHLYEAQAMRDAKSRAVLSIQATPLAGGAVAAAGSGGTAAVGAGVSVLGFQVGGGAVFKASEVPSGAHSYESPAASK